jgi:hypothetical protein
LAAGFCQAAVEHSSWTGRRINGGYKMSNAIDKFTLSVEKNEVVILFSWEAKEILEEIHRLKRLVANSQIQELISSGQASMEDMD